MEVFTSNMIIAVIMVHSECREVPNSRRNRERSHLLRGRIYLAIWLYRFVERSRDPSRFPVLKIVIFASFLQESQQVWTES